MSIISIQNLTFSHYGSADKLFDNLTLNLDTGWRLGLIGRNGRGKTTLLHLLMKRYEFSGGISSSVDFDYFPYELPGPERPTESALADLGGFETWKMEKELARLQVDPEVLGRPFQTLSGGERTKVMLAALFVKEGCFPLIDEPTNHLDLDGRRIVGDYLRRQLGFILVSHDRAFLDRAVDHILSINRSGVDLQKGNHSSWQRNQEYRDHYEAARNQKLIGEIKKLDQAARRTAGWSAKTERGKYGAGPVDRGFIGHKSAKIMKRSKIAERRGRQALEEKKGLLRNVEMNEKISITTDVHHSSRLLALTDISVSYDDRQVLNNIHFSLNQGERLLVTGPNGSGKSTLLKLAYGFDIPYQGNISRASGINISWLPQELDGLSEGSLKNWIQGQKLDESLFKAILHKLGFLKSQFETPLAAFSLGQKKKIFIAGCLCRPAHLHIWDEPLNYIDLISRVQIEELILEYQPTMLLVEHDLRFAETVATGFISL